MVFIQAIVAFLAAFLGTFVSLLPFDFEGLAPWIADVASPYQNATIVASSPAFQSPWTDTEIYTNLSSVVSSPVVASPSGPSTPLSSPSPSAHQAPAWKIKEPSFIEQLCNLLSLIKKAILKATIAVNDFLERHNLVQLANPRATLSWTGVSSDVETPRQKRLALFRLLRNVRLRRQPKRRHQWAAPEIKVKAPPPPPGPVPTAAYLAHLGALRTIKGLRQQVASLQEKLEASNLENEKLEELVNELREPSIAADPISPPSVSTSLPPISVPPRIPPPAVAVSCLKATAPGFSPASSSSFASSAAVSSYNATAPEFRPTSSTNFPIPAVSCSRATAPAFRPAPSLAPRLQFSPTGPPPPRIVQPMYGTQYDAAAFQYQQEQLQLERDRRALAQRMQPRMQPADPAQATEIFRRQFPNHGRKA